MPRKIKNFKQNFPFNLSYSKSNSGVLIGDRTQNDANLKSLFITHILNKKYNYNPYLVSDLNDKKNIPVYKDLDIKKFSINLKLTNLNYFFIFISSFFDLIVFYVKTLFIKDKINWLIKNFKCKKINIGDLIYDTYLFTTRKSKLDFEDPILKDIIKLSETIESVTIPGLSK